MIHKLKTGDLVPITMCAKVMKTYWHKDEEYCVVSFNKEQEPWKSLNDVPIFIVRLSGGSNDVEAVEKGMKIAQQEIFGEK